MREATPKAPFRIQWDNSGALKEIWRGIQVVTGLNRGGRSFPVFLDDRFLVSYPRSGNTWTRFLIANLLFPNQEVSFLNLDYLIPDVLNINRRELAKIPRPRLIKSHEYFDPRYKKVIYIVRDPRDVVVSYYYFHLKQGYINDGYPMEKFVTRFVSGDVDPIFASWGENVASWIATSFNRQGFLLLRYEDMKADTAFELARIADFLKISTDPEKLKWAVELSSADRMRELERRDEHRWIGTRKRRKDVRFIRTAISGAWKGILTESQVTQIESTWGALMRSLRYDLVTAPKPVEHTQDMLPARLAGGVLTSLKSDCAMQEAH
ncbi:MAG: sulfotransferase domain-containing protein [Candidatus Acidiferrales bacterium]